MVVVLVVNSFGASFGVPASGNAKCHGDAENRVLKRVGDIKSIAMKYFRIGLVTLISFTFSYLSFSQAPTASRNVMFFSSVASYETYAENENTWSSLSNIAQQSNTLNTMAKKAKMDGMDADTLYPEFLKEVLNTDNILQIGNYLIKIDLVNDRGLIIAAKNENSYFSLVKNDLETPGMMVLAGDEDFALALLESLENKVVSPTGYKSFLDAERACAGAKRRTEKRADVWANAPAPSCGAPYILQFYMDNKLVYQKAILYFSLQSKIISKEVCFDAGNAKITREVDLKLEGTVKYRKRCGPESNLNADIYESYFGGNDDGEASWRPYSGGRSLSHYDFSVQFGIRTATDRSTNPPAFFLSGLYNIKWGY